MSIGSAGAADVELGPLVTAFKRAPALIERNLLGAMRLVGNRIVNRAKEVHEYTDRTGLLTASIKRAEPEGSFMDGTLLIDVNAGGQQVYYGECIEDGTRHIRPYKFMANALEFVVENIAPKIFEDALVDALDEALGGGL